jgi:hypothetical protein
MPKKNCEEKLPRRPHEVSHAEDLDEALEDEVVQTCEEVINSNDTGEFMEQPIDDFICVRKHGWDVGCFGFDGDPIYDIEGSFQTRNVEAFPLEGCFSYMDDQDIWQLNDDMITDLFHPPRDGLLQCTYVDP